jgi:hypothetical protein
MPGITTTPVILMVTVFIVTLSGDSAAKVWIGGTVVVKVVDNSVIVNTVEGSAAGVVRGIALTRAVSRAMNVLELSILIVSGTIEVYILWFW